MWFTDNDVIGTVKFLRNEGFGYYELEQMYDLQRAYFWQADVNGEVFPRLRYVLFGTARKEKPRYRRCAEFTEERVKLFDEMLEHYQQSMTEFANELLDDYLIDMQ